VSSRLSPRDQVLYDRCDKILLYTWDPIGIADVPQCRDEYTGYLPQVWRLVRDGAGADEVVRYLNKVATEYMGLSADEQRVRAAVDAMLQARAEIWANVPG
jgi:hypothetical protein